MDGEPIFKHRNLPLLLLQGEIVLGAGNARLWAGIVAIVVAAVWRNTLLTIGVGFLALFLIQRF